MFLPSVLENQFGLLILNNDTFSKVLVVLRICQFLMIYVLTFHENL